MHGEKADMERVLLALPVQPLTARAIRGRFSGPGGRETSSPICFAPQWMSAAKSHPFQSGLPHHHRSPSTLYTMLGRFQDES